MKHYPLLACLFFLALNASAQSPSCPRVWRGGDTLWTDPAPHIQWLREGQPVPGANDRWLLPPANERASYSVAVRGGVSSGLPTSAA